MRSQQKAGPLTPYYQHGWITIYHADCREVLPRIQFADLLCTDPPYGIRADSAAFQNPKKRGNAASESRDYGSRNWDAAPCPTWLLQWLREKTRHQIIFGGNYFELPKTSCWLVWDKQNGSNGYADFEMAWTNLSKAARLLRFQWAGMLQEHMDAKEERFHPTQKPVPIMQWAIKQAPEDAQLILDPFMGSGTTLVAAKNLGRRAIGIEIEERYCEIAAKRLSQEVFEFPAVLTPDAAPPGVEEARDGD